MSERRWEVERSAWIKAQRWLDRPTAMYRAETLARRARQLDRSERGLGDSAMHEAPPKRFFTRWTAHEDTKTSALALLSFVLLFCIVLPLWLGIAWVLGRGLYMAADLGADKRRVRIVPFLLVAGVVAAIALLGRPLGWDLWAIHTLGAWIEAGTGGWIGPAVLSRWYAAGLVSWVEIQLVLGLVYAAWLAYAWGWAAPSITRADRSKTVNAVSKIISGVDVSTEKQDSKPAEPAGSPIKLISGSAASHAKNTEAADLALDEDDFEPAYIDEDDLDLVITEEKEEIHE